METSEAYLLKQLKIGLTCTTLLIILISNILSCLYLNDDNKVSPSSSSASPRVGSIRLRILLVSGARNTCQILMLALWYGITLAAVWLEWTGLILLVIEVHFLMLLLHVVNIVAGQTGYIFGIVVYLLWTAGYAKLLELIKLKAAEPNLFN